MPDWRSVRAGLLALVIGAHGIVALPIGPRVTLDSLRSERGASEVDAWMKLAAPLGFTRESFEETVVRWSTRLVDADAFITAPIKKVLHVFGQGQSWGLFASTDRDPQRLEVRGIRADGTEVVLYRRRDADARFLGEVLDYRRVRGVYDLGSKTLPPRYKNLCKWVAQRAFAAYPDLTEVKITQVLIQVRLPSEPPDPATSEKFTLSFQREPAAQGTP